ncbi:MAG TPA: hypothetical protein VIY27_08335 [Myxococcota bacterium]
MAEENLVIDTVTGRQKVGAGGGGGGLTRGQFTAGLNEALTGGSPGPLVVGGLTFDGSISFTTLLWRMVGHYNATGTAGTCEARLYDVGPVGGPAVRVLRSKAELVFGSAGSIVVVSNALTAVVSPGVDADEIHNVERVYEAEIALVGSDGQSDTFKLHQAYFDVTV